MRRHRTFLAGALLLLWANCVAAASEWPTPLFLEAENPNENVTWIQTPIDELGMASIYEGTEGNVEIMRLSYKAEGEDEPKIISGGTALGIRIVKDDSPTAPFFVQATESGDYEAGEDTFIIRVSAPAGTANVIGSVSLTLVNVNDNAPTINSPSSCRVKEEEEGMGMTDCKFVVTDADGGACYARMLVDDSKFSLHLSGEPTRMCKTATFILRVDSKLDYETFRLHSLLIKAEDDGQIGPDEFLPGYQEREVPFVVDVEDIPDEPPRWEEFMPSITVDEKTRWDQQIRAVDGDFGLNWPIEYHLKFPSDEFDYAKYFEIDKESGVLTGKEIDRDHYQLQIFRFMVVATEVPPKDEYPDFKAMSTSNDIVVMLNDINDQWPVIEPTVIEYLEFPEEQPFTDRNFTVSDLDLADHGTFHLSLKESPWSSNFALIPLSGYQNAELTISALNPSLLDYENPKWRNIELTIVAVEEKDETHTTTAILRIELFDLIDEPPEFEEKEYTLRIPENQPEGYEVVHAVAHDPDENDVISFTINIRNMEIDDEGVITTTDSNVFDYERQSEISFQVVATDTGNFKDYCQVNIELIDINDEQPTLILPPERFEVKEHEDEGKPASYIITATDPDTKPDLRFVINWEKSSAYSQGVEVKDKTLYQSSVRLAETKKGETEWTTYLEIANSTEFDWEVFDTMRLEITVIDDGTDPNYLHKSSSSGILTVNVEDINDNPPIFIEKEDRDNFTVPENTQPNRFIGSLIATDADSPPHSQIVYSLEPTFPPELVEDKENPRLTINSETGVMSTTSTPIDCDVWKTVIFKYKVTATDGKHITTEEITLYIEDDNDEFPKVVKPEDHRNSTSFKEHEPGPHLLSCIKGEDIDYSENFHTITYYIEGDSDDFFEMKSPCKSTEDCCLWAKDGSKMDREEKETHVIDVYSRDNYEDRVLWKSNPGPTVTITLTLEDINDNDPEFQNTGQSWKTYETMPEKEPTLFEVDVKDKDIGPNGEIVCEKIPQVTSVPERPEGLFSVQTIQNGNDYKCSVQATQSFRGYWGIYTLKLTAHDKGDEPRSGHGEYVLNVENENLNAPTILYPEDGQIIRLRNKQVLNNGRPLLTYTGSEIENFEVDDKDDPGSPNGQVDLVLTGRENDGEYFNVVREGSNTFRLTMIKDPETYPVGKRKFHLTLIANDKPEVDKLFSDPVEIDVYVIEIGSTPTFPVREATVFFHENTTGMEEVQTLPAATNENEELLDEGKRPIYYYIIGGEKEYFNIDNHTGELTLSKPLDYEVVTQHKITVGATHEDTSSTDFAGNAILEVTVKVIDINDMPPVFTQKLFPGAFTVDHDQGQHVIDLKAEDPDTNAELTFVMIPGTIQAHSDTLKDFEKDSSFLVNSKTGAITLNFAPLSRNLDGYFSFDVKVYDEAGDVEGHRDTASANVFVVSDAHQMIFNFYNPVSVVEANQDAMATEFSRILGYTCTVEKVRSSTKDGYETSEVLTYFVDETDKAPVQREKIEEELLKTNTNAMLYEAMQNLSLSFYGFNTVTSQKDERNYMTIALAAVCAVLAVLVVVFSLAFVVRTRTLNQRLEKLTSKKFGSQDSGLNRDSLAVPGTNRHALEGSNPVWNHDINQDFDNISQSSGDSDLIGIEDSPEFNGEKGGVDNRAYESRASVNPFEGTSITPEYLQPKYDDITRRTSINPLAAAAAAEGGRFEALSDPGPFPLEDIGLPRKISLNPLVENFDTDVDSVEVHVHSGVDANEASGTSNFSFQRPAEPSTEL